MVPQARLNPEAPEFFPNQHHHHKLVQSISLPGYAQSIPPQHYYVVASSSLPRELHPFQPHCVYNPSSTVPLTSISISFHDDGTVTNSSQQLSPPLFPLLPSEAEPKRFLNVQEKHQEEEVVVAAKEEAGSKVIAQKQVFKVIGCGRMTGRREGLRLQSYSWRKKERDVAEDQKCGHLKNRQVTPAFRRAGPHVTALPKKRGCLPLRVEGEETTVMIKNIPNKYSREMMVEFLDNHCMLENLRDKEENGDQHTILAYDFVYLPIDFRSGLNKGYAFVNFTNPEAAWKFFSTASNAKWDLFQSHKIREVVAARLQGKEKLERHFETMHFPCESEEVLPVCFSPPRDGVVKGEQRTMGKLVKRQEV